MTKRPARSRRPRRTQALVRRPATAPLRRAGFKPPRQLAVTSHAVVAKQDAQGAGGSLLDEHIFLGELGLAEVRFTPEEEAILSRPVRVEDIHVLPTGQVYLPHIVYTRWLNEAFGRTGWALRPASKPLLNEHTVVVPYLLLIHRVPVAFALGEQEYFANNKSQSYGDALESTVASGLRRCCKHLGIALDLWDRGFADAYLADYAIRVKCQVDVDGSKREKWQWRRRTDPRFWNEVDTGRRPVVDTIRPPAAVVEPVAHYGHAEEPITEQQLRRLWTIIRHRGRTDEEVKVWLGHLGVSSTKTITRAQYDTIVAAIEHPGPLVLATRDHLL